VKKEPSIAISLSKSFFFSLTCKTEFKKQEFPVLTRPETRAEGSSGEIDEVIQMLDA
jgi:hypothetical protein